MSEWNETCSQAPHNKPLSEGDRYPSVRVYTPAWKKYEDEYIKQRGKVEMNKHVGPVPSVDPELKTMLETLASTPDKNTPSSLKQLRWHIYALVDCGLVNLALKQGIEELFKEYTDS